VAKHGTNRVSFYPRRATLCYRSILVVVVCLSVRPSVTYRHCTKTAKRMMSQTTPYDSPGTSVYCCQKFLRNSIGITRSPPTVVVG